MATTTAPTRTFPFHALKPGDVIGGREVWDTRPVFGGWAAIDADGQTITRVRTPYDLVEIA